MSSHKSRIIKFFISVRLTLGLLAAIAAVALIGTLIPQQEAAWHMAERLHPAILAVFKSLQLFDIYHSVWFVLLLVLLAVNLIACSLDRFPPAWRQFRSGMAPDPAMRVADLPKERIIISGRPAEEETDGLEALLRKHCGRVRKAETSHGFVLAGEKGAFSRFGVFVVHLGVLLLILGGLAGALFGLRGYMEIAEGESAGSLSFRDGSPAQPLPFSIRCDRFVVENYANGAPKLFRSDLTFIENGRIVRRGSLLVNHPLSFGGLHFYQASYGELPGVGVTLSYTRGEEKSEEKETAVGETFELPHGDGKAEVLRVESDFMQMGPAVKLSVTSARGNVLFWVFEKIGQIEAANPGILEQVPMMNPDLFAPYRFSMRKKAGRFYTVIQASRDPGVPLVAGGAAILFAGLLMTFFYSHRRFRIVLERDEGGSRIGLAGSSNRNPFGLEREMEQLLAGIRNKEANL